MNICLKFRCPSKESNREVGLDYEGCFIVLFLGLSNFVVLGRSHLASESFQQRAPLVIVRLGLREGVPALALKHLVPLRGANANCT